MKTIKEKAEEYAKMEHTDKALIDIVSWDFKAGANYVLDVVEEFMKHNLVHSGNLKRLIEQLKK